MRDDEEMRAFDLQKETDRLLLARYVPACVVIDAQMEILHFRGQTSPYLELAAGKASLNLFKMARESLRFELRSAIAKARKSGQPVKKEGIQLQEQGIHREIMVEVIPFQVSPTERYFLILFEEVSTASSSPGAPGREGAQHIEKTGHGAKDRRIQYLERELMATRQEMHSIIEEMAISNEELQAANEEVLSSNEELRSLNEELETSREEIQASNEELCSLNEELETSREEIQVNNTQLHSVNQELQQRNVQLQVARAYTQDIVNTLREPLLVLDAALRVQSANPAFYQLFQAEPAQTEQHLLFELGDHQWDIPALRTLLEQVLPEKQSFQDLEVEHAFPTIGRKIFLLNARRIVSTGSREPLILLAFEDIDEQAAHMLATMEGQANKLAHLIGQLLDTTQLQTRTSLIHITRFDVTELVHAIVEDVQRTTQKHQIHLEGIVHKPFMGDPERISQVLTNLLSNAIKYSPDSTQILVRLREEAGAVTLSVQDFGMGIPADKQVYLFQRFYRVTDVAHMAIPGLGLGLYISSEIVKQHGGRMWVESREGEGSTFLPALRPCSSKTPPNHKQRASVETTPR